MRNAISSEMALGQMVIVVARWLLVLVGLLVAVWNPDPLPQLRVQIADRWRRDEHWLLALCGHFFLPAAERLGRNGLRDLYFS